MITIYICDSNLASLKKCKEIILHLAQKKSLKIRIQLFNSGDQLLTHHKKYPQDMEILYIDTVLKDQSGVAVVKELQSSGCEAEVIYLSNTEEHALDALDTSPLHYLLKSNTPLKKFEDVLTRAYTKIANRRTDVFTCESSGLTKWISLRSITYFEMQSRIVTVHYNDETFSFYSKMEQLQTKLANHRFIRTHRSFLVNLKYIQEVTKDQILMYDGSILPLGVTYSKQVKQDFKEISGPVFLKEKAS